MYAKKHVLSWSDQSIIDNYRSIEKNFSHFKIQKAHLHKISFHLSAGSTFALEYSSSYAADREKKKQTAKLNLSPCQQVTTKNSSLLYEFRLRYILRYTTNSTSVSSPQCRRMNS